MFVEMSESYLIMRTWLRIAVLILMCFSVWPTTRACGVLYEEAQTEDGRESTRPRYRDFRRWTATGSSGSTQQRSSVSVGWRPTRFDPDDNASGSGPDMGDTDIQVCDDAADARGPDWTGEGVGGSDDGDADTDRRRRLAASARLFTIPARQSVRQRYVERNRV